MASVSGVSSSVFTNQGSSINGFGQSLNALQSAVQSGNLSTAQTAFSSLLNYFPGLSKASNSSSSAGAANSNSPIATDLQSIQSAIQSGNASAVRTAVTKLTTDLHGAKGHGGHHHHQKGGSSDVTDGNSRPGSTTPNSASGSTPTGNPTADLLNALQGSSGSAGTTVNYLA